MSILADVLRDRGDFAGAVSLYEKAIQGLRQTLGRRPETLGVFYEFSILRKERREFVEARRPPRKLTAARGASCRRGIQIASVSERHLDSLR